MSIQDAIEIAAGVDREIMRMWSDDKKDATRLRLIDKAKDTIRRFLENIPEEFCVLEILEELGEEGE